MMEEIDWLDWDDDVLRHEIRGRRVYVGDATCEKRLPDIDAAAEIADRLRARGVALTLVTPFVSESGLAHVERLLDALPAPLEVVCNDWGVVDLVAGRAGCVPIAGRLLVRQDTDARWAGALDADFQRPFERGLVRHRMPPPALVRHLQRCALDGPAVYELLGRYGVRRMEINNLLQGIELAPPEGWRVSLHVPDVLVAVARDCAAMSGAPWPCADGCPPPAAWRHASVPVELEQRRNAVYYRNAAIPAMSAIDRIVARRAATPPHRATE